MPNKPRNPDSVNEILLDRSIRHAVFVQRLASGEARRSIEFLRKDVLPDLNRQIRKRLQNARRKGFDSGVYTTGRLKQMRAAITNIVNEGMRQARRNVRTSLEAVARSEVAFEVGLLEGTTPSVVTAVQPSGAVVAQIVSGRTIQDKFLNEWFSDLAKSTRREISQQINLGIVQAESPAAIMKRIRGTKELGFRDGVTAKMERGVEAVVRTATNHVNSSVRQAVYEENDEIIEGVLWVSTLDDATTQQCQALDGQVFPVDSGPRPPIHVNCRSSTSPVLKSARAAKLKGLDAGTRSSMDGQVPKATNFESWIKGKSAKEQDEILGPGRGKLLRRGNVPMDRWVNKSFEPLTLKELQAKEARVIR